MPSMLDEAVARIERLARCVAQAVVAAPETRVVDGDLTIDFLRNRVVLRGGEQGLTATEGRLLYELVRHAGLVVPVETLLARVWGAEHREEVHYVRLYVSYLRTKIEPDLAHPRYILMEDDGLGYRFADR